MNKEMYKICKSLGITVISVVALLIMIRTLNWQASIIKRMTSTREGFMGNDDDSDSDDDSDDSDDDSDDEDDIAKIHENNIKIKNYEAEATKAPTIKKYKKYEKKIKKLKDKNKKLLSGGSMI
tara:strand:- start:2 stop:370 length:369 start_codon:yes stop_codon:yes gene_type:complete